MRKSKVLIPVFLLIFSIMFSTSVSAAETSDEPFSINITTAGSTHFTSSTNPVRVKTNSTSTYINYNKSSGPVSFIAIIYGCDYRGQGDMDCTTYAIMQDFDGSYYQVKRPPAVVRRGTRGFVRQDVYERACPYAKLKGKYNQGLGKAEGVWSPDSVYEDIPDYNA